MYSYVDMPATGARLRDKIFESGYNVKSIQEYHVPNQFINGLGENHFRQLIIYIC